MHDVRATLHDEESPNSVLWSNGEFRIPNKLHVLFKYSFITFSLVEFRSWRGKEI